MKIALASDHAGYALKQAVSDYLSSRNTPFQDFGCGPEDRVDYVDFAVKAIDGMKTHRCDRLILICGTGLGMAVVANKFRGIRATPCFDAYTAEMSRKHNDSNCLTMGGRILPVDEATEIVRVWLDLPFEAGRHAQRIAKISDVEDRNFKSDEEA